VEDDVVVLALQRGRRWEEHVCVAGGLVQVRVDGDEEVERVERLLQPCAVGRGEDRVAARTTSARMLAGPVGENLLGERGDGELAAERGQLPDPGVVRA
jgi:hypothetical protein